MSGTVFSLSSPDLGHDCGQVVALLRAMGVAGDVTPNRTLQRDGQEEAGCRVVLPDESEEQARAFWSRARALPGVRCAHVALGTRARTGCVFDVLAPTRCPGAPPPPSGEGTDQTDR